MPSSTTRQPVREIDASAIVVGQFDGARLSPPASELDEATGGTLSKLLQAEELSGKLGAVTTILAPQGLAAERVVVTGLGSSDTFDQGAAFKSAAAAAKSLAGKPRGNVVFYPRQNVDGSLIEAGVCGAAVGCRGQDIYRAKKNLFPIEELLWYTEDDEAVRRGDLLGSAVNLTRELVNEPASSIYPESFADRAAKVAQEVGLEAEVWDQPRLEKEGCGALLAVARGSSREPRLAILRYSGGPEDQPAMAFVGKGVTFDSGGLSLKPSEGMATMKCDMAGAATVLGAMQAIAQLKLPVNVIGLVGLVENMVSGDSYKLGDVLKARNGKTIEVLNTDAEGRLVLADVLDVALQLGASRIVDLATLTGACVVALGLNVAGAMTNDQDWCDSVLDAARTTGEAAWQLPMFSEFGDQIKSKVADIKNVGEGRWGGAITAAKFLEEFVGETPWVHLDIAGPAFLDSPAKWIDAGGSGAFVRTLVEVAKQHGRGE